MRQNRRAVPLLAGVATAALLTSMLPIAAFAAPTDGAEVTGTYSTGTGTPVQWAQLDASAFGAPSGDVDPDVTVTVDPSVTHQEYEGMGFSIDETAVANWWKLDEETRRAALAKLVDPVDGAGFNQFRIQIGSSDLIAHLPFWSYNDLPPGVEDDFELEHFSIQRDIDLHMIDAIKLIQELNPDATFFASAWSAPAWMKTNNLFVGEAVPNPDGSGGTVQNGRLRDDCIDVFARYYVKTIETYAELGIDISAITLLNEPGMDVVYPAMDITIPQQQELALAIKREFAAAGLDTKLWVHDFNFWDWRDPNSTETKNYHRIFEDSADGEIKGADVLAAVDGIGFHPYWGDASVMADANSETGKPVYMTETNVLDASAVVEQFRYNGSSYSMWAQTTDERGGTLHWTDSRSNDVDWEELGRTMSWPNRMMTVDTTTGTASYNNALYRMGQLSRHLEPGDVRVGSSAPADGVSNVVYQRDGSQYTAVLDNTAREERTVLVELGRNAFTTTLPARSTATFEWDAAAVPLTLAPLADVSLDQGSTATVQLVASGADGLEHYGVDLPAWAAVDPSTGLVTLEPTEVGSFSLELGVTDGTDSVTTTLAVSVAAATVSPVTISLTTPEVDGWHGPGTAAVLTTDDDAAQADARIAAAVDLVELSLDGGPWSTYEEPVPLPEGSSTIEARATDAFGNVSEVASRTVQVDAQAPSQWSWLSTDGALTAAATDPHSGVDRIEYSTSGGAWTASVGDVDTAQGVTVRSVDVVGNVSEPQEIAASETVPWIDLVAGSVVHLERTGLEPGAEVRVLLQPGDREVARASADADGVLVTTFTVPDDVSGQTQVVVVAATGGDDGSGAAPGGGGAGAAPDGQLPQTGLDSTAVWVASALALLLAGTALTLVRLPGRRTTLGGSDG